MKWVAWILAALFVMWVLPQKARAQTVGLHVGSVHLDSQLQRVRGWNDVNPGVYVRWDNGVTVGMFVNSVKRRSHYLGWTGDTVLAGPLDGALTLGVVDGYGPHVLPLVVPSVALRLQGLGLPGAAVRLSLLANPGKAGGVSKDGAHAVHLSVEQRW